MNSIRLIEYGSSDYQEMVKLRDEILRKPLGLHFTEKYLQQEVNDILIGCFETDEFMQEKALIGCCILSPVIEDLVQMRQMAVRKENQRSGIGKELMAFAEKEAVKNGFSVLMMHARKTAIPFYELLGYRIAGDEFLEVGIPHFEMRKKL